MRVMSQKTARCVKIKVDKRGQLIAQALMPPTRMEALQNKALTEAYHEAKGNISLTARLVGWSRTKTLNTIKFLNLYKLYKHDPWPVEREHK